ncbi:MAG: hypothetical protein HRT71_10245 [Flavobacteriales bacterium]|nr:hypothetical protein [Flavobacteriales bacterium]
MTKEVFSTAEQSPDYQTDFNPNGQPIKEWAFDDLGKYLTELLTYNDVGHLVLKTQYDREGDFESEIKYEYHLGNPSKETYFKTNKEIKKVILYTYE